MENSDVEVVGDLPSSPSIKLALPGPSPASPVQSLQRPNASSPLELNETTVMKYGLFFVLVFILGGFFVSILAEKGLFHRIHGSPHEPTWQRVKDGVLKDGVEDGALKMVVAPWECVLAIVLVAWRLARVAADRLFPQQTPVLRAKCGNYMLELFGTTMLETTAQVCITIIDIIILNNYTKNAYIFDTPPRRCSPWHTRRVRRVERATRRGLLTHLV
jgi:hypothetical protein